MVSNKQQQTSMHEMDKNQNFLARVQMWLKFRWMIAMGMKYTYTRFEEMQQWRQRHANK